jgi:hypothetical protein
MLSIRSRTGLFAITVAALSCAQALAGDGARVLILSSGDTGLDGHAEVVLESFGHTATVGPRFTEFTGKIDLSEYDVVYFQANVNWASPDMPEAGQASLVDFVNSGGGILTSEWVVWLVWGSIRFQLLDEVFPGQSTGAYSIDLGDATYAMVTPDPVINAGLPDTITFPQSSFSGTQTEILPRPDAVQTFYSTTTYPSGGGVIGGSFGEGRVIHLSTCAGSNSLNDANFQRLFSNCVDWLNGGKPSCPADFNNDSAVNSQDFFDFLTEFFETDPAADFNGDSVVNSQDFFDFLAAFFAGC